MADRRGCNVAAGSARAVALLAALFMIMLAQGVVAQGSVAHGSVAHGSVARNAAAALGPDPFPVAVAVRRVIAGGSDRSPAAPSPTAAPTRGPVTPEDGQAGALGPIVGWTAAALIATALGSLLTAVVGRRRHRSRY